MKMNLEQTVQYLLDCIESGIKIEELFTDRAMLLLKALDEENEGKYYLLKEDNEPIHLFVITKEEGDRIAQDLGEWPKPGIQGVPGPTGPAPEIKISPNGTWVINGIDTKKPSRGIKGETGHTGMQGRPGAGAGSVTEVDGTDYDITVSEGEDYDLVTTSTRIHYYDDDEEKTDEVTLKYYVPHRTSVTAYFEMTNGNIQPTSDMKIPTGKYLRLTNFNQIKDSNNNTLSSTYVDKANGITCSKNVYPTLLSVVPVISRSAGESAYVANTLKADSAVTGNALVQRTSNGSINVPLQPNTNNSAASKKYVDDAIEGAAGGGGVIIPVSGEYDELAEDIIPALTLRTIQLAYGAYTEGKATTFKVEDEEFGTYWFSVVYVWGEMLNPFIKVEANAGFSIIYYVDGTTVYHDVYSAVNAGEQRDIGSTFYRHVINFDPIDLTQNPRMEMVIISPSSSQVNNNASLYQLLENSTQRDVVYYKSTGTEYCQMITSIGPGYHRLRYYGPGNDYLNTVALNLYRYNGDTVTKI